MEQLALMIDLERCIGCRSCEAACKQEHRLGSDVARNRVLWMQFRGTPRLDLVLAVCQQCQRPACVRACASTPKAIIKSREDGVVRIDGRRCTGCQECIKACPYNAISFDFRHQKAEKCDLCSDRRAHGFQPACVSVCPGRALEYGLVDDLLAKAMAAGRERRSVDHFALGPSVVYLERLAPRAVGDGATGGCRDAETGRRGDGETGRRGELPLPMGEGRGEGWLSSPPPPAAFVATVTREGRGVNRGRRGPAAGLLAKLPRLANSLERFPYDGAPPIWEADQVKPGGCNLCFNSCTLLYYLKEGQVIGITGNPDDPQLQGRACAKAQMQLQQFYSPHRLLYPMKRSGRRGEGKFRRIGWDEALDEVAAKLKEVKQRYGPEALAIYTGTRAGFLTQQGSAPIFADMFGTPNREGTGPFCGSATNLALPVTQGTKGPGNSYTPDDVGSAQFYLFVGDNMAETRPVYFGILNDCRLKNRARMVVVDPRLSVTASKADEWLPIRPGTDMALALAMLHYIISHDLVDHRFVDEWVLGYEEWRRFILERGYTPQWAEGITDIPVETIERLAREFATTDRAVIVTDRGLNQHSNGSQTVRCFLALCAFTGHYGRKGAGLMTISNGLAIGAKTPPERKAPIRRPAIRKSPAAWIEAMESGRPYPIKALIMATNPFVFMPDLGRLYRAIQKVDLMVHLELWPNETTAWADYVFPSASSIEMGEINRVAEERRLVWIEKLIDPPGEARPDTHFWIDLGKRFGFDDVLREEYKDSEKFWDHLMLAAPRMKGMTVRRLRRHPHNSARGPLPTEDFEERETLFEEGSVYPGDTQGRRFPTPSGKLEFWTPELEAMFSAVGLSALPEFYSEPDQLLPLPHLEYLTTDADEGVPSPFWPGANSNVARIVCPPSARPPSSTRGAGGELASLPTVVGEGPGERGISVSVKGAVFDTELVTGRPPAGHFHSWTHFWWQSQEMWPDQYVQIHPEKASGLGIRDGDRVVVETSTGSIEAVAWLYPGIRKSAVYIPIGWGERQPYNPWKGSNWLISKEQRDPASDQTNFKALLCRVRRA